MFLTPDAPASEDTRYILLKFPAAPGYSSAIVGALAELTKELNWEKSGSLKPYEVASIYARMVQDMRFWTPFEIGDFVDSLVDKDPAFFLPCDGSTYQAADWPELFAVLPGSLKGTTTFTLPDMAGVSRVGVGMRITTPFNFLEEGGAMTHTLTENEIPAHAHLYTPATLNLDLESPGVPDILGAGIGTPTYTGNTGGGQPHNNMPPHIPIKMYIVGKLP